MVSVDSCKIQSQRRDQLSCREKIGGKEDVTALSCGRARSLNRCRPSRAKDLQLAVAVFLKVM